MIDWVHATSPFIDEIIAEAGIAEMPGPSLERSIRAYISGPTAPPEPWVAGTTKYASLDHDPPIPSAE
jgi:hypothetical protein